METLRNCTISYIVFYSEETGFAILKAHAKGYPSQITLTGSLPGIRVFAEIECEGEWTVHPKYGEQFKVSKWHEILPVTVKGIEAYLGSGMIKGIGKKNAKKIVQTFGDNTFEVLEHHPERLLEINGIGEKKAKAIKKGWVEQKEVQTIMAFLQGYDISPALATRIYKEWGEASVSKLRENPYRLADEVWGIGFKTADDIAGKLGLEKDSFSRLQSGILYTLKVFSNSGHCYAKSAQLVSEASKLLEIAKEKIEPVLSQMIQNGTVETENDAIYLPLYYHCEKGVATHLARLIASKRDCTADLGDALRRKDGIEYDPIQKDAIRTALTEKVMVITGGPGVGKTTTILGVIRAYKMSGRKVLLAAPTGRAAKRMSEATGMESKTIHRLLEFAPDGKFQRNDKNPLEGDVLIVDESSMIDILLMNSLLKAVPSNMSVILVGDIDQLPSVGAGNVLKDIIDSGVAPVVRLTKIFRQAQGSRIITNAHKVNHGELPDLRGGTDSDFFFLTQEGDSNIADTIVRFCSKNLPSYYHANPLSDIQVLSPMKRGECGTMVLNQRLQEVLNPSSIMVKRGGTEFRLKDKVMQIRNNYDKGVFNGDIGFISNIDLEENEVKVVFDGREVSYDVSDLAELVLAYACTIHKSQGSEYPIVVMPMTMGHYIMLQRNLLYTGITRAKKIIVLVGDRRAVERCVKNGEAAKRNTKLAERLREKLAK